MRWFDSWKVANVEITLTRSTRPQRHCNVIRDNKTAIELFIAGVRNGKVEGWYHPL